MPAQPSIRTALSGLILVLAAGLGTAPALARVHAHHSGAVSAPASAPVSQASGQASSQATPPASRAARPEVVLEEPATLHLANRPILTLQTSFLGMTPAERVRRAEANIEQALLGSGPGRVTTRSTPEGELVLIDGVMTIVLHGADADVLTGDTMPALLERTVAALNLAIAETQEGRDTRSLLISLAWVLGATAVAGALLWALSHLRDAALRLLERFLDAKTRKLADAQVLRRGRVR